MTDIPISHDESRRAASCVLDHPGADGIEVVLTGSRVGMTRFARSEIIQNTLKHEIHAYVRVVVGDRTATATTTQLDAEHLGRAAARALEAARASRPDAGFPGLPSPEDVGRAAALMRWDDATAAATPEHRSTAVADVLRVAQQDNVAGIYETSAHSFAVLSSRGIDCFDAHTRCVVNCLVDTGEGTGWADDSSHTRSDVDVAAAAHRALAKARASEGARDAEPGVYEVVLEPAASGALIEYLSYSGFGAKQMLEGESFLASRSGTDVAARQITVADDVWHPRSVGIGFDFEGVPKRRVAVIDEGRATTPVTDLRTAAKVGGASTGHNSGSTEFGPYASNVVLHAGDASIEELVAGVSEGFLVTRFHYVNILDRPDTLLTGMTRDGVYEIHNGEVARPVHNFRFAQSVLDALASVRGVGRDLVAFAPDYGSFGSVVAPALHVGEFNFASRTTH